MTSLESILKNFYLEKINENRYPNFGKPGRADYIFVYKHFNSQSEAMKFESDIKYRLASHLVNHCHPSYSSEQQSEQEQQQGTNRTEMSSLVFCSKCGKTEKPGEEFTNKDGSTICKECWLDEENDNNKDQE